MDTHGIPNGEKGAFACIDEKYIQDGLTKREYFAGLAMQGICAGYQGNKTMSWSQVAYKSVVLADELLKQLEEQ